VVTDLKIAAKVHDNNGDELTENKQNENI